MVIVSAINEQKEKLMLGVLPDRKKETVKLFLETIPVPIKATIQQVCVDMYEGYSNAAYEALPGIEVIVDRFHVANAARQTNNLGRAQWHRCRGCTQSVIARFKAINLGLPFDNRS